MAGECASRELASRNCAPATTPHLALACQDVVNHMPSLGSVRRSFAAVRRALAPSGWLGFDTITRYCFETYWTDNTHLLEGPLGDVIMSCDCEPKKRRGTARIISYPRRARGGFDRHDTVLYEYFYADRDLARCLREAGFARVWSSPWSPWRVQDIEARRHRRLWCAAVAPVKPEQARLVESSGLRLA